MSNGSSLRRCAAALLPVALWLAAPAAAATAAAPAAKVTAAATVDVNTAGVQELASLPGIGPALARRIVEFREKHGPFQKVEELLAVKGIGPRLLERLRGRVTVGKKGRR